MGQITRTYKFSSAVDLDASQVESEIFNIVNTWNSTDRGILKWSNVSIAYGGALTFTSLSGALQTTLKYTLNQFQIIADSGDGLVVLGNACFTANNSPSYGSGTGVIFIADRSVAPTTTPANGLILYSESGLLKYEDSSGVFHLLSGESVNSAVTSTAFSASGNYGDLTSINLTSGTWLVSGVMVVTVGVTTTTAINLGISTTTGNSSTGLTSGDNLVTKGLDNGSTALGISNFSVPSYPMVISSNTTVYLKYRGVFSGGTPTAEGRISAVRIK